MATFKSPKVGLYGDKDRLLQQRISFERTALSWKFVYFYKYLGSRTNNTPSVHDVPDPVFLEVSDRAYSNEPVEINAWYETLPEQQFDLSRFGIVNPVGNTQQFRFHTYSFESDGLGRYPVVGDIIEVPFLEQDERRAFFEITDVDRKQEFENFIIIVTTIPVSHSQETTEIHDVDGYESNESEIENVINDIDTHQKEEFEETGFDTSDYENVTQPDRNEYDPRPDHNEDFLDDPNKKVF